MLTFNEKNYNIAKIKWSCRRGMLELDKILLDFVNKEFEALSDTKKEAFVKLLDNSDTQLYKWFIGDSLPTEYEFQDLVLCIRHFYANFKNNKEEVCQS